VRQFGGDPGRVLVFGESAGAVETCMLLVSPLASGLFGAALMESGGCVANDALKAAQFAGEFASAAGCAAAADVAGCLRAQPLATLMAALPPTVSTVSRQSGFQPNVDGLVIPDSPLAVIRRGQHNHVPFVVGVNSDETSRETVAILTAAQYQEAVLAYVGGSPLLAALVLARYPIAEYGDSPRRAFTAVTSDANFICPARRIARAAAQGQAEPVYRYVFTHAWQDAGVALRSLGGFHGIELAYVFDHMGVSGYQATPGELALRDAITLSWRSLAASGEPGETAAASWPRYEPSTDPFLRLEDPIMVGQGARAAQCDFWDTLTP
jgi:para-nitrobenzyl esterase